jgi:hypothetical protein
VRVLPLRRRTRHAAKHSHKKMPKLVWQRGFERLQTWVAPWLRLATTAPPAAAPAWITTRRRSEPTSKVEAHSACIDHGCRPREPQHAGSTQQTTRATTPDNAPLCRQLTRFVPLQTALQRPAPCGQPLRARRDARRVLCLCHPQ